LPKLKLHVGVPFVMPRLPSHPLLETRGCKQRFKSNVIIKNNV
jgi:hypothetical protein